MGSITKDTRGKSPYWIACYTGADGSRLKKSTKQRDRTKAMGICLDWERAAKNGRAGMLTEAQARKVVSEIVEKTTGQPLNFITTRDWFQQWLAGKTEAKAERTGERYGHVCQQFIAHLGKRADLNIAQVSPSDVLTFREKRRKRNVSNRTLNLDVKIVAAALNAAQRQGLITVNPANALESLPEDGHERDVFSPEQVAKLVLSAEGDWKLAILLGFYTGARLQDVANMVWSAIDFKKRIVQFTPRKTKRLRKPLVVPLHAELEAHLLKAPGIGNAPVLPSLAGKGTGGSSGLSRSFGKIMESAGIVGKASKTSARTHISLSFHSLRHSFTSALANKGVDREIRQKLTGHADEKSHAIYTHHEIATLRAAVNVLPNLASVAA